MLLIPKIPPLERGSTVRRAVAEWRARFWLCIVVAAGTGCAPPEPQATVDDGLAPSVNQDWQQFSDPARGIDFRYPRDLGTEYIHTVDWPPQVRLEEGPFTCQRAGEETERAGRTEPKMIGGRTYCVTRVMEGAAGSVYTMYAYATPADDAVIILTFSLRAAQCGNYDEERRAACESERAEFSVGPTVGEIVQSVTFSDD